MFLDDVEIDDRLIESITRSRRNNRFDINLTGSEEDEETFKDWGKKRFSVGTLVKVITIGQNRYENYKVTHVNGSCNYIGDTANFSIQLRQQTPAS